MLILLYLKKLIARILFPEVLVVLMLIFGLWWSFSAKSSPTCRKWGKFLLIFALCFYLVLALFGDIFLGALTNTYKPLNPNLLPRSSYVIGVACSAFRATPERTPDCWFNNHSVVRMHEAGRLAQTLLRRNCEVKVVLPIYHKASTFKQKQAAVQAFFRQFNIPEQNLVVVENAFNSRQEVKKYLKFPGRLILVSDASHVPRLMVLAHRYGATNALPAPAARENLEFDQSILRLVPSSQRFSNASTTIYELLGILEAWIF